MTALTMTARSGDEAQNVTAFNVFGDSLVARYLDGSRVDDNAKRELELIKTIQGHQSAKTKQRAHALLRLIKGETHDAVTAMLTDEKASQ